MFDASSRGIHGNTVSSPSNICKLPSINSQIDQSQSPHPIHGLAIGVYGGFSNKPQIALADSPYTRSAKRTFHLPRIDQTSFHKVMEAHTESSRNKIRHTQPMQYDTREKIRHLSRSYSSLVPISSSKDRPPFYPPGPHSWQGINSHSNPANIERLKQARIAYSKIGWTKRKKIQPILSHSSPDVRKSMSNINLLKPLKQNAISKVVSMEKVYEGATTSSKRSIVLTRSLGNVSTISDQRLSRRLAQSQPPILNHSDLCNPYTAYLLTDRNSGFDSTVNNTDYSGLVTVEPSHSKPIPKARQFGNSTRGSAQISYQASKPGNTATKPRPNNQTNYTFDKNYSTYLTCRISSPTIHRYVSVCNFTKSMLLCLSNNSMGNTARLQATGLGQGLTLMRARIVYDLTFRSDNSLPQWCETDNEVGLSA